MQVRGAIHIHSRLSRDGELTIPELASFYRLHGYHFLGISEHAEDMTEAKVGDLLRLCADHSDDAFCLIPGLEFVCDGDFHIVGLGAPELIPERDRQPVPVISRIKQQGGVAILAHPRRYRWQCPPEILRAVHASEIWNVNYDGKFLPPRKSPEAFERFLEANPELLAIVGHDFHRPGGFYDVALHLDVAELTSAAVLDTLRAGRYEARSAFFDSGSRDPFGGGRSAFVRYSSWPLEQAKRVRNLIAR